MLLLITRVEVSTTTATTKTTASCARTLVITIAIRLRLAARMATLCIAGCCRTLVARCLSHVTLSNQKILANVDY